MTTDEKKILSHNIKYLRKSKHMTQSELARQLDVGQTTVSEWEKGRSEPDSIALLKRICSIFDVTFDEILDDYICNTKIKNINIGGAIARKLEDLTQDERDKAEYDILTFLKEKYGD